MREITYAASIAEAIKEEMKQDENVIVIGEDVGPYGGNFKTTAGLWSEFGDTRVIDTPISEAGFTGAGLGLAITGMKPVVELMFGDFVAVAMDQLINQIAKMRYMSGGKIKVPIVIRTNIGAGRSSAAQHSQSLHAFFMHVPGFKIAMPSNPYDAKGLLKTAIRDESPVMFFEHKMLYNQKGFVPDEEYTIPFGSAKIIKEGKDVTILATSLMVHKSLEAANILSKENIDVEIIDPRTLIPLDEEKILSSVKKTKHLLIVDEGYERCGITSEIAFLVMNKVFDYLDAPIERVCNMNVPIPFSKPLEEFVIPNTERIIKKVKQILGEE